MVSIAIVGIRGIPNNYGGFETLAEYLAAYLSADYKVTVYCSSVDMPQKLHQYKNARLKYIPVSSHGFWGIIYDSLALLDAVRKNDKILVLGFGCGFIVPFLGSAKKKLIVNIGGLDWKRDKWGGLAKKVIRKAEQLLLKNCGTIIADNKGIQDYIQETYQRDSFLIFYGGDQSKPVSITADWVKKYPFLSKPYCFSVARIQPDNNTELILEAMSSIKKLPMIFVGNLKESAFGEKMKQKFSEDEQLILLDAIYNREELDVLRSNCKLYIHGHSAGGTNPSLVEAMFLGLPVFAFDSIYNRYTTEGKAVYFNNEKVLAELVNAYEKINLFSILNDLKQIAASKYTWKAVAEHYREVLCSIN